MTDLRVLIADDEQSVLDLVSRFLQSAGVPKDHQTILPSCAAAIEHYKKDPNYHLVITDLNQSPSGADVVEFVRNHHGDLDTRVAVMTGGNAPPDILYRAQRLTDFFIEKPFKLSHTLETISATRTYFSRVGANPEFPKQWYVDNSNPPILVLGVEGTADDVRLSIERFRAESGLQIDWSPVMPQTATRMPWTLTIGNVYTPDVCTLQVGQNVSQGNEKPYTSIVSTGIGQVVIDLMKEFIAKSNMTLISPGIPFVMETEMDQVPLKAGYFGLLDVLKDPELAKRAFVENLRLQQGKYRSLQN